MHHRNDALEQAIIEAPDDPAPRLVYGDWLQAAGDVRGEWMTLSAAIAANPDDIKLRSAAMAFLDGHKRELLGDGLKLLAKSWFGWHTGFVDELRLQPVASPMIIAKVLAHPSCRFVRHVAIGNVAKQDRTIVELVRAAPPLLESVLAIDSTMGSTVDLDPLADVPTLRRLGHHLANVRRPMPQLVELAVTFSREAATWISGGGCPNVSELTVFCGREAIAASLPPMLRALPALRRLRLIELTGADAAVASLDLGRLELLDLSHSDLTWAAALVAAPSSLQILALRTQLMRGERARLEARGAIVSTGDGHSFYELSDEDSERSWIAHRIRTEGRASLRLVPSAGLVLFNLGTVHLTEGRLDEARPLIEAGLTYPEPRIKASPFASAGILYERLHDFDRAELHGREGLLRDPDESNFFAIVIDALRRSDRLDQALALIPRAQRAIERDRGTHSTGATAALNDCLVTLLQAGRPMEVVALAERFAAKCSGTSGAIVAHAHVMLGDLPAAGSSLAKAHRENPFAIHARAAWLAAKGKLGDAIKQLAKVKGYAEWHWVARDPTLAPLAEKPAFRALFA